MAAPLPDDELERLAVLYEHALLDTLPEEEFNDLVRLAAHLCGVPIAAVSLIDEHRQWFKAIIGLDVTETPRSAAFCAHTILQQEMLVVPDTQADSRFTDNPLVTGDPHIRFYAGVPLVTEDGYALGSLCVIDRIPRQLTPEQKATLQLLARQVASQLRAARRVAERERLVAAKEHLIAEREQAEAERLKLDAERERLAAIVESSEDAIYSVTLAGRLTSWNAGAERLYGYAAAEIVGRRLSQLIPLDRRGEMADIIAAARRREDFPPLETVRLTKRGECINVSLRVSPILDNRRRVAGVYRIARDITERIEAEEALQAEREFTHALLDSLQEGIVACDKDGTLTLFNRATREFHGLPEQPLPPEQWAEHFDLYEADGVTPMRTQDIPLFRAFEGEVVRDAEMVISPKFGPTRTLFANGRIIRDAKGRRLGAVAAMHDVTTRRQNERELARMAAIVESSEEAILGTTLDGTFVSWNRGAEKLYGYAASEMIGQHVSCLVPAGERSPVPAVVTRLLRGETVETMEVIRTRRDGVEFFAELTFSPIRSTGGDMVGVSCIARDITATKRAEAALVQSHTALAESEERLRRLTDAAFEGIAVTQGGLLVDVSPAFAAMFGYDTPAAMIGLPGSELAAPESHSLVAHKIAVCDEDPYEAILQRRNGTTFEANLRGRLIQLGGRSARVTAVRDISEQRFMERSLRESEATMRALLASAPVILFTTDREGIITLSEGQGLTALGLTPGEVVGHSLLEFSGGDPEIEAKNRRALAGEAVSYDMQFGGLWLHLELSPMRDAGGIFTGVIGITLDMTERIRAEERFRVLFEQSSDAHLLCGPSGIVDCNDATLILLRCDDKAQMISLHPAIFSPEFQPDGSRSNEKGREMEALAREKGFHRFEWTHRKMDGEEFPVEVTLTPVTLADGPVLLAVLHDLTERKKQEEQIRDHSVILEFQKEALEFANAELEALATTDGLTGLRNHRAFQERLAEEAGRAARYGTPLSVIILDVDHFKQYNDAFGHPAGDSVLRTVAQILQGSARDTDLVARYGGEEFVLVLPQTDRDGAAAFAERLRTAIECCSWPVRAVTASFGVSTLHLGEEGSANLIERADSALYRSKEVGRNRVTCDGAKTPLQTESRRLPPIGISNSHASGQAAALLLSDLTGTFLQVNHRACAFLGYSEAELVGTNGFDLIHPDDIACQGWRMDDVVAGQIVVTKRRLRRKDGTWLCAEMHTRRLPDGRAECVLQEIPAAPLPKRDTAPLLHENQIVQEAGEGFSMLDALVAAVDNKDRYTRQHSEGVRAFALMIAQELGLDEATQDTVTVAALVHDVGKIGVPDDILRKPGTLTEEEFEAMKRHPQLGAAIVSAVSGLQGTLAAVRHHHERWDGGGYPFGLRGTEIPFLARLMAVADAFSAMTTDRPYRKGMTDDQAQQILQDGAGSQWDPDCVAAFLRAYPRQHSPAQLI